MSMKERWSKVVKKNGVKQTGPFFVPYKRNLIPLRKIQQVTKMCIHRGKRVENEVCNFEY